ncbi:MAG: hypothetical protein IID18_03635, partial [Nitrospinae bacterium]|nr:hypothetical protein [Nitrospinota bacterium]
CTGGLAPEDVPIVTPSDYESYASYLLNADGTITDQSDGKVYSYASSNWTSSGGSTGDGNAAFGDIKYVTTGNANIKSWKFQGTNIADGMYYAKMDASTWSASTWKGNINIFQVPDPWTVTLLADGWIDFQSNGTIVNFESADAAHTDDIDSLLFIAGTDLKFSGTPANTIQGIIACGEQIDVSSNVTLSGYMVASDASSDDDKVTANQISGNMTITYNGNVTAPFLSNKVIVLSWQEI